MARPFISLIGAYLAITMAWLLLGASVDARQSAGNASLAATAPPFLRLRVEPAAPRPGLTTAIVEWDAGNHPAAQVTVSMNGGSPRLFAAEPRGSNRADWIASDSSYVFRLYDPASRAVLASSRLGGGRSADSVATAAAILGTVALLGAGLAWAGTRAITPPTGTTVSIGVAGLWLLLIAATNPIGEFPLNDDWAYAWSVRELLRGSGFRLSDWTAVNLLPQVAWGAAFSLVAGFSFTALRISTLVAALAALYGTIGWLRELGAPTLLTVVAVLSLALNPLFFALAHSFNSDVPSLALFVGTLYAFARGLAGSRTWLWVGVVGALIAITERQTNLVLLPALALAYLVVAGVTWRSIAIACTVAMSGFVVQVGYSQWLRATSREPLLYGLQMQKLFETLHEPSQAISVYLKNGVVFVIYLGLFLFPLLLLVYGQYLSSLDKRRRRLSLAGIAVVVLIGFAWLGDRRMPLAGNVLERAGIGGGGPSLVAGYYDALGSTGNGAVHDIWTVLTIIALAGAAIWVGAVARTVRAMVTDPAMIGTRRAQLSLALMTLLLMTAGVGGVPPEMWFDRYLLAFLPVCAALAIGCSTVSWKPPFALVAATTASLLLFGLFSVATTHDLLASSRARWQAYDDIMGSGQVRAGDIAEWDMNGWHFGQRIEECNPSFVRDGSRRATWEDFVCLDKLDQRRYVAAYEPVGGTVVARRSFQRWFPPLQQTVYIVERSNGAADVPGVAGREHLTP